MSGILIAPVQRPARPLTEVEAQKMNWGRYFGGKERGMPRVGIRKGGSIKFAQHIGRGLTQQLWDDIVFRLQPSSLEIYVDGAETKGSAGKSNAMVIWLQSDGRTVKDVEWFPGVMRA